jgi:hypothetical protein
MARPKPLETRYVVAKDYYKDGDNLRDEFPILYGTKSEAEDMMSKLNGGSDPSFFDSTDEEEAAVLYVDSIFI